jgi:hypothetical protein
MLGGAVTFGGGNALMAARENRKKIQIKNGTQLKACSLQKKVHLFKKENCYFEKVRLASSALSSSLFKNVKLFSYL